MTSMIKRRGRPKQNDASYEDTRSELLRVGVVWLTQYGFSATGLEPLLRSVNIPKGSFYHYFESKEAFGLAVLAQYRAYFERKLERHLEEEQLPPFSRLRSFMADARMGMEKYAFERGCLVGNLEQEATHLSSAMRQALLETYQSWQRSVANCLRLAQQQGLLAKDADVDALAHIFWVGWEGAVARARLMQSSGPLVHFEKFYIAGLPRC